MINKSHKFMRSFNDLAVCRWRRLGQTVLSIFDVARQFTCQEMPWAMGIFRNDQKSINGNKVNKVYMAWLCTFTARFNRYPNVHKYSKMAWFLLGVWHFQNASHGLASINQLHHNPEIKPQESCHETWRIVVFRRYGSFLRSYRGK